MCILNNILVYVNLCIVWYKDIQCYIVYMKCVSRLYVSESLTEHIHTSQATFFLYSLPFIHEQPMLINKSTTMHK